MDKQKKCRVFTARGKIEIGSQLGHYTILKILGQGGMGTVYLARENTLRREVALKVIKKAYHLIVFRENVF